MAELRICRICLSTSVKMYRLERYQLKAYYEEVMALKVNNNDNLPQCVCYECAMMLNKFHKFKEKCYSGQKTLKEMLWRGPITYETVSKIDKTKYSIQRILQIINDSSRIKNYHCKGEDPPDDEKDTDFIKAEAHNMEKVEIDYIGDGSLHIEDDSVPLNTNDDSPTGSQHQTVFDVKNELILEDNTSSGKMKSFHKAKSKKEPFEEQDVMRYHAITNRRRRFLDAKNWKKYSLTENEAKKLFKRKSEQSKYLRAAYKCTDCYKGFSKEEMLNRHVMLRHSQSLGMFECRFCKMRFKWDSHLRIHMRQHFTKYKCLRCHFECPLENSAILHEEYHSGITRKCIHCEEEFRHASTYYTHLRTAHRSEYVCTVCGVSFVSEVGLHQHKRVKHINLDIESPDDDEDVNTYCDRCDVRFDTRKAFEEHLFHSVMHAEGVEHEIHDEIMIPRKVLGKRLRAKITKELHKRKQQETVSSSVGKRRKKLKRKRRKPTTCYQCGQHFDTQTACMKHHLSEHPRTSFYPPGSRHVCEICGASLAPGSVAVHNNMHTREKVFTCETCGKQFHSTVGLRRHVVTHTGEKRFACTHCDKRFTQSNSMKLHYRTFHLKQPYPKRDRKKKTSNTIRVESSSEEEEERSELDSLPDPNPEREMEPQPMELEPDHEDTVHYLTLN